MVLTSFRFGIETVDRYSSRPSATPAGGRVMKVETLSSRPSTSPRTSAVAVPTSTSSGVEYFIGVHLLSSGIVETLPPQLEPTLQPQYRVDLSARRAAALGQRLHRGPQAVAIDPAALDDLQRVDRVHVGDRAADGAKGGWR